MTSALLGVEVAIWTKDRCKHSDVALHITRPRHGRVAKVQYLRPPNIFSKVTRDLSVAGVNVDVNWDAQFLMRLKEGVLNSVGVLRKW